MIGAAWGAATFVALGSVVRVRSPLPGFCFPLSPCSDVWLTGEMTHHDCIAAASDGVSVIVTNHTNTERGYLEHLQSRLQAALPAAFPDAAASDIAVVVTALDADPLVVL